ncbi:MAG: response regulator, partial [Clostridia bacterium]|nr:response regulator [Clostridia bacterium]
MEKTILIVDDEAPIVDILRINLKKNGYKVLEAYDGEAAVKIALGEDPDLILLDVMLPKMDGFTVCRKLRERINTPIV